MRKYFTQKKENVQLFKLLKLFIIANRGRAQMARPDRMATVTQKPSIEQFFGTLGDGTRILSATTPIYP